MDGSEIKVMFGSREVGRIFESSNPLTPLVSVHAT